ncbi:hypothetical protein F4678DRAFT_462246 [Xylaria arbuscula]|nr:hypothetical protein F4678DRAFT_462246 [Xylaria arbuscula]
MNATAGPPAQPARNSQMTSSLNYRAAAKVDKMIEETPKIREYGNLRSFLYHVLVMLYNVRIRTDEDMHAYLKNEGDEAKVDIWMSPFHSANAFLFKVSTLIVNQMRMNGQTELARSFQVRWHLKVADKANEVVVTFGDKPETTGNFDLSACLKHFPSEKIDLGVIGLPGQDGTPADNVMYRPTLKDVYFTAVGMAELVDEMERNYALEKHS